MSKDTIRALFRQLARNLDPARDIPAENHLQALFFIEEAAAALSLPELDPIYRFDGRLVALRGNELYGRLPGDNPANPLIALGSVELAMPQGDSPQFARYVQNGEVVLERVSGAAPQYPKVRHCNRVWDVVRCELNRWNIKDWALEWLEKLNEELRDGRVSGGATQPAISEPSKREEVLRRLISFFASCSCQSAEGGQLVQILLKPATAGEKLSELLRTGLVPPTASARQLAELLEVSPSAVKKTAAWKAWQEKRRDDRDEMASRYEEKHIRRRGKID